MNKDDYLKEADRQLSNTKYYEKLDNPIYPSVIPKINAILTKMRDEKYITQKQFNHLRADPNCSPRTIYFLPKVHKPKKTWPTQIPECRPIVSDINSESYNVNGFLDYHINPLSIKHETYIKDTYDFLQKVRNRIINKEWILVTGDVTSLYTNMNINRTIAMCKTKLSKNTRHRADLISICLICWKSLLKTMISKSMYSGINKHVEWAWARSRHPDWLTYTYYTSTKKQYMDLE